MHETSPAKKIRILLPALVLLAITPHAMAQLYTWKDAQGNVIIKNMPPPWYNESERSRGARVQVLRYGKVIDDTAWPADKRQEGRNKAASDEAKRARETPQGDKNDAKDDDDK